MIVSRLVALLGVKQDSASFNKAQGRIQKLRGLLRAATAAATAMGTALVFAMQQFAREADQTIKHARKIRVGVEALQELQFAGQRSGMSLGQVNTAMQRLERRTADAAKGIGPAVQAFAELGLNAERLSNMDTDQVLERVIGALQNRPRKDWNRILTALADIEGTEFAKLAEGGLPAFRALRKEAQRLGGIFTEDQAKQAEAYQDAMFNLKFALTGIRNVLASDILPTVTNALNKSTQFIAQNRDGIMFILKSVGVVVAALAGLAFGKVAVIGGIIGAIILALEDIRAFFQGKKSITGIIVDGFTSALEKVEQAWDTFKGNIDQTLQEIKATIMELMPQWLIDYLKEGAEVNAQLKEARENDEGRDDRAAAAQATRTTAPSAAAPTSDRAAAARAAMYGGSAPSGSSTVNNNSTVLNFYGVQPKEVVDEVQKATRKNNAVVGRDVSRGIKY